DNLKAEIDKITNSIEGIDKVFGKVKEKAKEDIDKYDNLSKEEKDNLKAEIDKTTNSIEAIDKVFDKVKEKLKAVIDKLDNLSKEEK
ncbi:GA module-containing protein, partial [Gemelliphila asaccharolytica]